LPSVPEKQTATNRDIRFARSNLSLVATLLSSQAGPQADAAAKVRAHQKTQEQTARGLWLVTGSAASDEPADHPLVGRQDQPVEAGCSASSDVRILRQLHRACWFSAERRLGLGHSLWL